MSFLWDKLFFWRKPAGPAAPLLPQLATKAEKKGDDSGFVQFEADVPLHVANESNAFWLKGFVRDVVLNLREIGDKDACFLVERNDDEVLSGRLCFRDIKIPLFSYYRGPYSITSGAGRPAFAGKETVLGVPCCPHDQDITGWERCICLDIAKIIVSELYRSSDRDQLSFKNAHGNPLLTDILAFAKQVGWNIPLTEAEGTQKEGLVRDDLALVLGDLSSNAQKLDAETQEIVQDSVDRIRETLCRLQGDDTSSARRRYSVLFNLASVCGDLLREYLEVAAQGALREGDLPMLRSAFQRVAQVAEEKQGDPRGKLTDLQSVIGALLAENGAPSLRQSR